MRLNVRGVDHLYVAGSTTPRKYTKQPFPDPAFGPAHKAIVDRRRRTIFWRAIAPPAAALDHMKDAADHATLVDPLLAAHILWQMRLDLPPLIVAQPEQIVPHRLAPRIAGQGNQQPIQPATTLLDVRPSRFRFSSSG